MLAKMAGNVVFMANSHCCDVKERQLSFLVNSFFRLPSKKTLKIYTACLLRQSNRRFPSQRPVIRNAFLCRGVIMICRIWPKFEKHSKEWIFINFSNCIWFNESGIVLCSYLFIVFFQTTIWSSFTDNFVSLLWTLDILGSIVSNAL